MYVSYIFYVRLSYRPNKTFLYCSVLGLSIGTNFDYL